MVLLMAGGRSHAQGYVDPTGTYLLKGDIRNNQILGHYGELRVRLLDANRIAIAFYLNTGYPDYESGSFVDTLSYDDDRAVYNPRTDSACRVVFAFAIRSVELSQVVSNPRSGCGFRPGVMQPEVMLKTSGNVPVIEDLSVHGTP